MVEFGYRYYRAIGGEKFVYKNVGKNMALIEVKSVEERIDEAKKGTILR